MFFGVSLDEPSWEFGEEFGGEFVECVCVGSLVMADKEKSVAVGDGEINGDVAVNFEDLFFQGIFNFFSGVGGVKRE